MYTLPPGDPRYTLGIREVDCMSMGPERDKGISNWIGFCFVQKAALAKELLYWKDSSITQYALIKAEPPSEIRDKGIAYYLWSNYLFLPDTVSLVADAITTATSSFVRDNLQEFHDRQTAGSAAYPFALPDIHGKIVRLADFKGKVVFMDFWYTGCGWCLQYYQHCLSKAEAFYKNNPNVVFVSVSIDAVPTWDKMPKDRAYTGDGAINLYTAGKG